MADFVAVLNKTIDGLGERNTAEMRQKVYERAKRAIGEKLAAITPQPSAAQSQRQYKLLDEAIAIVEAGYTPPLIVVSAPVIKPLSSDPLADFLAEVEETAAKPVAATPVKPAVEVQRKDIPSLPLVVKPAMPVLKPTIALGPELDIDATGPLGIPGMDMANTKVKKGGSSGLLYGLLGLLVIGGAGYAGYLYKDEIQASLGSTPVTPVAVAPPAKPAAKVAKTETPSVEPVKLAAEPVTQKMTQRLTADGTEVDAGASGKPADVVEGESVAAATTPSGVPAPAPSGTAPAAQTIAVGQKAIFYEEKTGTENGTADQGAVVWSVVQDSPGLDQPDEPAIRGEVNIPEKGLAVRMTIKRNVDKSLPASHIIEMLFTTPADFAGGAVEGIQRFAMKDTEQAPGNPLVGVPASFGDGFFLIALTDEKTAIETNTTLLKRQNWIDIPVAYRSGRRALLSFEKGLAGDKVFQEVFKAWDAKTTAG